MKFTKKLRTAVAKKMMCVTTWSLIRLDKIIRQYHIADRAYEIQIGHSSVEIGHMIVTWGLLERSEDRWCSAYNLINAGCDSIFEGLKLQGRTSEAEYIKEQLQKYCESIIEQYDIFKYDN